MTTATLRELVAAGGGLVVQSDIARHLGVSTQRVGQLIAAHDDFPEPIDTIGPENRPVWLLEDVREWQQRRRRRLKKRRQRGSPGAARLRSGS